MSEGKKTGPLGLMIRVAVLLTIAGVIGRYVYLRHVPALYTNRGVKLADDEKYKEAVAQFEKALAINPKYERAKTELARVLVEQAEPESQALNFDEVVRLCTRAIKLGYHKSNVHFQLAWAYWRLGKSQPALEQLAEQEKYFPDDHRPANLRKTIQAKRRPSWDKTKVE